MLILYILRLCKLSLKRNTCIYINIHIWAASVHREPMFQCIDCIKKLHILIFFSVHALVSSVFSCVKNLVFVEKGKRQPNGEGEFEVCEMSCPYFASSLPRKQHVVCSFEWIWHSGFSPLHYYIIISIIYWVYDCTLLIMVSKLKSSIWNQTHVFMLWRFNVIVCWVHIYLVCLLCFLIFNFGCKLDHNFL